MSSRKQPIVRKPSKKIAKTPVVRLRDAATQDSGAIRFGNGSAPAILRSMLTRNVMPSLFAMVCASVIICTARSRVRGN